jgi:hypothetical protein
MFTDLRIPDCLDDARSDAESTLTPYYEDDDITDNDHAATEMVQTYVTTPPATEMTTSSRSDAIQLLVNGLDTMITSNDPTNVVLGIVMLREDSGHHAPMERWQDLAAYRNLEYMVAMQKREIEDLNQRAVVLTKTVALTEHILEKTITDLHSNINRDLVELEPQIRSIIN